MRKNFLNYLVSLKKIFNISFFLKKIFFIFCFFFIFVQATTIDKQDFFKQLKDKHAHQLPNFFKVELESSVVSLQFKVIPKEMILFKETPRLFLLFKKKNHPILILEGVLEYYVNYFAPYESIIQNTGIFFGIDYYDNYQKFSKEFDFKVIEIQGGFKAKVREKEGLRGDYAEYLFNKDLVLNKVIFYKKKIKHGESKIFYRKFKQWTIPKKIIISFVKPEIGGLKEFSIHFKDYLTEEKLGEKFFLKK